MLIGLHLTEFMALPRTLTLRKRQQGTQNLKGNLKNVGETQKGVRREMQKAGRG